MCHRGVGNNNLLYCLICKGCNDCCLSQHGCTNCLDHGCTFLLLVDYNNNNIINNSLSTTNSQVSEGLGTADEGHLCCGTWSIILANTTAVNNRPNLQPRRATPTNGTPLATSYYLLHPIHPWHSTDTRTYGQNWSDLICCGLAACVCSACTYVCVCIHSVVSMQAQMHP